MSTAPPHCGAVGWDMAAVAASFQITMLEGIEVVFIVIAIGAGGAGLLVPASLGAVAALLLVIVLGLTVHRPLANVPENSLKFVAPRLSSSPKYFTNVGVLLSAFGTFWVGEGLAIPWPGGDWAIPVLIFGFLLTAALTMGLCRSRLNRSLPIVMISR